MPEYKGEVLITIQAPVEIVYAYLADFTKHPQWVKNISKITQVAPGQVGVGTTFRTREGAPPVAPVQKARMNFQFILGLLGGAKPYSEARITALEPNRRIAWQAGIPKGKGFFNLADWEFVLEAEGKATRLTQCFHWRPQTPGAERMVGVAGADGLRRAVAASLVDLKRRLETGSTGKG